MTDETVDIFFSTSPEHRQRFLAAIQQIGKVYGGRIDQEYGAALYILTSDSGMWNLASSYVNRDGISFETIRKKGGYSGGESVLMLLAGNLFNSRQHIDPVEFMRLDDEGFRIAITALYIRRSYNLRVDAL